MPITTRPATTAQKLSITKGIKPPAIGARLGEPTSFAALVAGLYGFGPGSVYLSPAPRYHAAPAGWVDAVHRLGGTAVVMDRFDPVEALSLIEAHRVTHVQFVLLASYGGIDSVRRAQQFINKAYRPYTGIIPTDGLYGREMNTALIQVLQSLEGFSPSEATGNFGNGTRSRLKTITANNASSNESWVWLASTALAADSIFFVCFSVGSGHGKLL